MFIKIDEWMINVDSIYYVYFYEQDFTNKKCCYIKLEHGERIDFEDPSHIQFIDETLRKADVVIEYKSDDSSVE